MVQMKEEPHSPVQNTLTLAPAVEEEHEDQNTAHNQPATKRDLLDRVTTDTTACVGAL